MMKYHNPFSTIFTFLISTLFFLVFHSSIGSADIIHDSCRQAANSSPNLSYDFCVSSLEANPKSKSVKSLDGLVVISLELTVSKAASISSDVTKLLKDKSFNGSTKKGLSDCSDLYSDAYATLQEAKNDLIKLKDHQGASIKVSSTMDASTTCEDGLKERGGISPLSKDNKAFFQSAVMVLAFINMLH